MRNEGSLVEYVHDRDEALLSMDKAKIVAYMQKWGVNMIPTDETVFWAAVHKARTAIESFPIWERAASKYWLTVHDMESWDGGTVYPPVARDKKGDLIKYYQRLREFGLQFEVEL